MVLVAVVDVVVLVVVILVNGGDGNDSGIDNRDDYLLFIISLIQN